jgi:intracellular septation protein
MEQYFDLLSFIPFAVIYFTTKNIVWASLSSIAIMSLQVIYHKIKKQPISKMLWFSLTLLTVFTGLALLFPENSKILLWKPTVINCIFALGLWLSKPKKFLENTIGHQLLESQKKQKEQSPDMPILQLSTRAWLAVHDYWAIWFLCLAILNVFIVLYGSTDLWVTMKGVNLVLGLLVNMGTLFFAMKKYPN